MNNENYNIKEGLEIEQINAYMKAFKLNEQLQECNYCAKFFKAETIVDYDDDEICLHCYFCINYTQKDKIDGKNDIHMATYISNYKNTHPKDFCLKKGMCVLCDYLDYVKLGIVELNKENDNNNDDIIITLD